MNTLLSLKLPTESGSVEIPAPSGVPTFNFADGGSNFVAFILVMFFIVLIVLALGFILYGGLNWIMSQGDKTKLESARRTIIFAILGLVLGLLGFFIIGIVGSLFGINLLNVSF